MHILVDTGAMDNYIRADLVDSNDGHSYQQMQLAKT